MERIKNECEEIRLYIEKMRDIAKNYRTCEKSEMPVYEHVFNSTLEIVQELIWRLECIPVNTREEAVLINRLVKQLRRDFRLELDGMVLCKRQRNLPSVNPVLNMSLCIGRHDIPQATDGSVFAREITDITDVAKLENDAFRSLWNKCFAHYSLNERGYLHVLDDWDGSDAMPMEIAKGVKLNLYVTGLTVALIAVLNVCRQNSVKVTLYHYDRETGNYFPQNVE